MIGLLFKLFLALLAFLASLVVLGVLFLLFALKPATEAIAPKMLGSPLEVRNFQINPFNGTILLEGFVWRNPSSGPDGNALEIEKLQASYHPLSPFQGKMVFDQILVQKPVLGLEMDSRGSNWGKILEHLRSTFASTPDQETPTEPLVIPVAFDGIIIQEAQIKAQVLGMRRDRSWDEVRVPAMGQEGPGITDQEIKALLGATLKDVAGRQLLNEIPTDKIRLPFPGNLFSGEKSGEAVEPKP